MIKTLATSLLLAGDKQPAIDFTLMSDNVVSNACLLYISLVKLVKLVKFSYLFSLISFQRP